MEVLRDVTIVVPTFERPSRIWAQIRSYDRFPLKMLILDGSDRPVYKNRSYLSKHVRYFSNPGQKTFFERLLQGISLVETEYLVFLDDEDYISVSGIRKCCEELINSLDLQSACGLAFSTDYSTLSTKVQKWGKWFDGLDLSGGKPLERVEECLKRDRTANIFYGVHRTSGLIPLTRSKFRYNQNYSWSSTPEFVISLCAILAGGHRQINFPFLFRNNLSPRVETAESRNLLIPSFEDVSFISNFISSIPGNEAQGLALVDLIHRHYLALNARLPNSADSTPVKVIQSSYMHFQSLQKFALMILKPIIGLRIRRFGRKFLSSVSYSLSNKQRLQFMSIKSFLKEYRDLFLPVDVIEFEMIFKRWNEYHSERNDAKKTID